ncbi:MAG: lipase family protein [Planctomycetota bacterium]
MPQLRTAIACTLLAITTLQGARETQAQSYQVNYAYGLDTPGGFLNLLQAYYGAGFDHFDGYNDGSSLRNQYLLSHLSMIIYSNEVNLDDFEDYLWNRIGHLRVHDIEVFGNSASGADGAIITTADSVIVVFRGTSSGGFGGGLADQIADINIDPVTVDYPERRVKIKDGIWDAVESVYDGISKTVDEKVSKGKRLWVTGHSLGGACATLTAFRLHYEDRIEVAGLQTFGALAVGDAKFVEMSELPGPNGVVLANVTRRFTHYEDPAATVFNAWTIGKNKTYYHHFGATQTIFSRYMVWPTPGPVQEAVAFWEMVGRLNGIHMEYELAIRNEVEDAIDATGDFVLMDLMADIVPHDH